jgi:hypothetical protein
MFNKGLYLTVVPTDIDLQGRDPFPKTEIGADENGYFGTLPVDILDLSARGAEGKITVDWQTINEKDIFGYALLRSKGDDSHFEELISAFTDKSLDAKGTNGNGANYAYNDVQVENGIGYFYKLISIDNDGSRHEDAKIAYAIPRAASSFAILGNYPNPFSLSSSNRISTTISYTVAISSDVKIVIADVSGRIVRTLVNEQGAKPGTYGQEWDARDNDGNIVPSGTYFSIMTAKGDALPQGFTATQKIVLTK